MSASADLQLAIEELLRTPYEVDGVLVAPLRTSVQIVRRRPKDLKSDIEAAAAAQTGLYISVMPPLPKSVLTNVDFVFFDKAEVRVRILERIPLNNTGVDAYDLLDDVAVALQWQRIPAILSHPLELANPPCVLTEDAGKQLRQIDVLFNAVYGLNPNTPAPTPPSVAVPLSDEDGAPLTDEDGAQILDQ